MALREPGSPGVLDLPDLPDLPDLSKEKPMIIDSWALTENFLQVAELSGISLSAGDVTVESLPSPHRPPQLPKEKMAVYVFCYQGRALKVGRAGPKSGPRYTSHHYNPTAAKSTLAASLLHGGDVIGVQGITRATVIVILTTPVGS